MFPKILTDPLAVIPAKAGIQIPASAGMTRRTVINFGNVYKILTAESLGAYIWVLVRI
jgi:hypothetical protein